MVFKRILVPLDGSPLSERALAPALKIAALEGSRVTLLRVPVVDVNLVPTVEFYGNYSLRGLDLALERARLEARDYLAATRRASQRPNVDVGVALMDGDPAEAIVTAALQKQSDLIVMSTHGYSGVMRWIMGSVTERVLSHAPCPVLVVRSETPLTQVLVPLDGSPLAEKALAPALEIAAAVGASVTLLRAVKGLPAQHMDELNKVERGLGLRARDEILLEAEAYLRGLADQHQPHYPTLPIDVVVRLEPAASAILDYAEATHTDLVAMATHGRTGAQKWLYGSVTEKVLHNSRDFALLVVRP